MQKQDIEIIRFQLATKACFTIGLPLPYLTCKTKELNLIKLRRGKNELLNARNWMTNDIGCFYIV